MWKFRGLAKTHQPFSAASRPKFTKFGGMYGSLCRLTSLFPIGDIMFHFNCRDIFGQSWKSVLKTQFLPPKAYGGKCLRTSDQIFKITVISEYVPSAHIWLRSVQWPQRLGVERKEERKKEEKTIAVGGFVGEWLVYWKSTRPVEITVHLWKIRPDLEQLWRTRLIDNQKWSAFPERFLYGNVWGSGVDVWHAWKDGLVWQKSIAVKRSAYVPVVDVLVLLVNVS